MCGGICISNAVDKIVAIYIIWGFDLLSVTSSKSVFYFYFCFIFTPVCLSKFNFVFKKNKKKSLVWCWTPLALIKSLTLVIV